MEIDIKEFKKALHEGEVEFKYTKKDGSERTARGTLNIEVMGEENAPTGTSERTYSDNVIRYYDLNSEGWRSFVIENLVEWTKA